ncbi:MAG: hypothetical protein H6Q33_290 [Deltaproteobacteria bacterium]|nr:hypothetical protein [Deltaproteobacteria bacterium]
MSGVAAFLTAPVPAIVLVAAPTFAADPMPSATSPVAVQASVDRSQVTIGDPIRYTVEVSAAADTEVLIPVLSGSLGDFAISDFGELPSRKENGRIILARWYTLTIFATGDHLVPAPTVQYRTPGEELREAEGNEVLVGVTSLLAQETTATDIRDIKPPEEVPFDWRPYGIVAAVVAAVGLLGAGLFYLLNRPRRQRLVPAEPPHEVALAALNKLRALHLVESGQIEEYYVRLSAIVRRYLEDRFSVRAPEMTTEEFLVAVAGDGRLAPPHRRLLGDFLSQADLVKFARHLPTLQDTDNAHAAARRFVEDTRPAAPGQGAEGSRAAA